jgi:pilus assembly protein CpaF
MTPHRRPPDPRDTGRMRDPRTGGATGAGGIGAGGIGVGAGSGADQLGGLPPGLVARVQRRLAATGPVAADPAGLQAAVAETLAKDGVVLPAAKLAAIVRSIGDELTGLGPLAPLLADPTVTDVLVNGPTDV